MNKVCALFAVMPFTLLVLVSGCSKSHVEEGTVVSVIYSSDTHGNLEGCGCKKNGGGITHRAARILDARKEDPTVLYVDAGNFQSGEPEADDSKGNVMVAVYNQLGATTVNLSERELAYGLDAFNKMKAESKFDYVSANVRADGNPVAEPFVIKDVKGAKVAIVGLCAARNVMRTDSSRLPAGVTVEDPLAAAKRVIPGLAGKADIIVVLSTCGDAMDSLLAQSSGLKIDLIVGGRSFRPNTATPWLFGPGFKGGSVGGYTDLNERVAAAEDSFRSMKGQYARGLVSGDELAKAQKELEDLKKQQAGEKGESGGHNACVVRTARDGRELGRMDLVFGAKGVIKTFSPKTLPIEISDPSNADMLAVVRKYLPNFVDTPVTP